MASETIVAVFPSLSNAEAAISDLVASGVSSASIKHYARDEGDEGYDTTRSETETQQHGGFWAWLTGQETTREHHDVYDRSIESGRTVVTVISDGSNVDHIYSVLERHDPVDLDEHDGAHAGAGGYGDTGSTAAGYSGTGASSAGIPSAGTAGLAEPGVADPGTGYTGTGTAGAGRTGTGATGTDAAGVGTGGAGTAGLGATGLGATGAGTSGSDRSGLGTSATGTSRTGDAYAEREGTGATGAGFGARTAAPTDTTRTGGTEEVIPLAEETLDIGKREVNRGSTRIRRYVVERPVDEQIRLRDEAVSVFRRPASGTASVGSDAFQDREIVVTETGEEAVVAKTARVVEEVVVQKGVEERVETVRDTVRREEVEIDGPAGRNVAGATGTSTGTGTGTSTGTGTGPGTGTGSKI